MAGGVSGKLLKSRARRFFMRNGHQEQIPVQELLSIAERMKDELGNLKGVLMKAGQMASYLDATFPEPMKEVLAALQDSTPPMSPEVMSKVFKDELGEKPEQVFPEWSETPFAAASIGQVHKAVTRDGQEVAVKIQYPEIKRAFESDLLSLKLFEPVANLVLWNVNVKETMDELRERLLEECDYTQEAKNQNLFCRLFAEDPDIRIGRVLEEYSAERVLTTEFIHGKRFKTFVSESTQQQRNRAAEIISKMTWHSIFKHRVFNADPHPGNYLFRDDKVYFIDFGCVKKWSEEFLNRWKRLVKSALERDDPTMKRALVDIGFVRYPHNYDFEAWRDYYTDGILKPYIHDKPFKYTSDFVQSEIEKMYKNNPNLFKLSIPKDFVFAMRLLLGFDSVMATMQAESNWRKILLEALYDDPAQVPPPFPDSE